MPGLPFFMVTLFSLFAICAICAVGFLAAEQFALAVGCLFCSALFFAGTMCLGIYAEPSEMATEAGFQPETN